MEENKEILNSAPEQTSENSSSKGALKEYLTERYLNPLASGIMSVVVIVYSTFASLILILFFVPTADILSSFFHVNLFAPFGFLLLLLSLFVFIVNIRLLLRGSSAMPGVSFVCGIIAAVLLGFSVDVSLDVPPSPFDWIAERIKPYAWCYAFLEIIMYNLLFCLLLASYNLVCDVWKLLRFLFNRKRRQSS